MYLKEKHTHLDTRYHLFKTHKISTFFILSGIKLEVGSDSLGQQYLTPSEVISHRGCDVIIVGRGILMADNPAAEARKYRAAGYTAYLAQFS